MITLIIGGIFAGLIIGVLVMPVIFYLDEKKVKEIKTLITKYQADVNEESKTRRAIKSDISILRQGIISGHYKRKVRDLIELI